MEMSEPERIQVTIIQAGLSKIPNGSCATIKEQEVAFHPYYQSRWPTAGIRNTGAGADNASFQLSLHINNPTNKSCSFEIPPNPPLEKGGKRKFFLFIKRIKSLKSLQKIPLL